MGSVFNAGQSRFRLGTVRSSLAVSAAAADGLSSARVFARHSMAGHTTTKGTGQKGSLGSYAWFDGVDKPNENERAKRRLVIYIRVDKQAGPPLLDGEKEICRIERQDT